MANTQRSTGGFMSPADRLYNASGLFYVENASTALPHLFDDDTITVSDNSHFVQQVMVEEKNKKYPLCVGIVPQAEVSRFLAMAADNGVRQVTVDTCRGTETLPIASLMSGEFSMETDDESASFTACLTALIQETRSHRPGEGISSTELYLKRKVIEKSLNAHIFLPFLVPSPDLYSDVRECPMLKVVVTDEHGHDVELSDDEIKDECLLPVFTSVRCAEMLDNADEWQFYGRESLLLNIKSALAHLESPKGVNWHLILNPGTLNWVITSGMMREILRKAQKNLKEI